MPNHRTHDIIGVVSVIPIDIAALYLNVPIKDIITLSIGIIVATYYLSPDLDIHSKVYNRWGLFRIIWFPYQKLIPHRSWLSHSGPISGTLRLMYLMLWLSPLTYYMHLTFNPSYGMIWLAVVLADTLHVVADLVVKDTQ